jgi:hypothetical protein
MKKLVIIALHFVCEPVNLSLKSFLMTVVMQSIDLKLWLCTAIFLRFASCCVYTFTMTVKSLIIVKDMHRLLPVLLAITAFPFH